MDVLRRHDRIRSDINRIKDLGERFTRGTSAALRSWLMTSGPAPLCLFKPFSCEACLGIKHGIYLDDTNKLYMYTYTYTYTYTYIHMYIFPEVPRMKRVYKNKKRRRSTGQQSGTKSACGPADTPVVNRSSTARCVPRSGLHWISFVRASEETSRTVAYGALEGKDGRLVVSLAHRPAAATSRPDPPRPAPPRSPRPPCRRAPSRPGPPMVCLGFGLYKYTYTYIYIYMCFLLRQKFIGSGVGI